MRLGSTVGDCPFGLSCDIRSQEGHQLDCGGSMKRHVPDFANLPPEQLARAAMSWFENYDRVRNENRMLSKILIGFVIVAITLFVFWQQDRNRFKYACRVMYESELHLPNDIDLSSEAETNITRAMKGARIEAEC